MKINIEKLTQRVQKSKLLTEKEKQHWTNSLPTMNDAQIQKLDRILSEAEIIEWTPQMDDYISIIQGGQLATQPA